MDSKGNIETIYTDKNNLTSEAYTVVTDDDDKCAIVWSTSDENNVLQMKSTIYDIESDSWTESVFLSNSNGNVNKVSGYYTSQGKMEFLYTRKDVDNNDIISLCALQVEPQADIEVMDAYVEDGKEIEGENISVFVGVTNNGCKAVSEYTIDIDGQETTGNNVIMPGESKLIEALYKVPSAVTGRDVNITVKVDNDRDESNNSKVLHMG